MPPVRFLSFLLPQRETALFFGLLLLLREHFLLLFGCIPLELQSLLRFCADPAGGGLLAQHSPFPFGIDCLRPNGDGDRWTEFELTIVLQDEVPYLAVFRLCTECDPVGGSCAALDPFEYADPERRLEAYRQAQKMDVHNETLLNLNSQERTTRRGGLLTCAHGADGWATYQLWHIQRICVAFLSCAAALPRGYSSIPAA